MNYSKIGSRVTESLENMMEDLELTNDPIERLFLESLINAKYQYEYDKQMIAKIEYEKKRKLMEFEEKLDNIDIDDNTDSDDLFKNTNNNPRGDNENMWGTINDDRYSEAIKKDKVNNGMMERLNTEIGFTMDLPGPDMEKILRPFENDE